MLAGSVDKKFKFCSNDKLVFIVEPVRIPRTVVCIEGFVQMAIF